MILEKIKSVIADAVENLYPGISIQVGLEIPPEDFGDLSTTIPLKLARALKKSPIQIAEEISQHINSKAFQEIQISKPGFLNFFLSVETYKEFIASLEKDKEKYFYKKPNGKKVQIEFVSANPTGPLHVGNGRGGIIGDVLANLLKTQGFEVEKEYYVNDSGSKMDLFAQSILYYYLNELGIKSDFPEDGYKGDYIQDIAKQIITKTGNSFSTMQKKDAIEKIKKYGKELMINNIKTSLESFGIHFDNWFYETDLYKKGEIQETLKVFIDTPYTYACENAIWFKSTLFGDDKDRVLVRSNGEPTYTLADATYHRNKWKRGFQKVIDVWGADHFGHIIPMKALIKGMGLPNDFLDVIIYQIVHLFEDGKEVVMSKHTGSFITLDELIKEVGKDAARIFFLLKSADTHLNFDLNLAKSQSIDNPVYYMQYTYARLTNIIKEGAKRGIEYAGVENTSSLLLNKEERDILINLIYIEELLDKVSIDYSVHKIPFMALELAQKINAFYQKHKVLQAGELAQQRLALVNASLIALSFLFDIMGIEKREKM
jgi:arginyl-tRNA synthetase